MTIRTDLVRRGSALALTAILGLTLAACGDDKPTDVTTTSATAAADNGATKAYQRYWDVYVQLANSGDINPSAFSGIAEGNFIEIDLKGLSDQADSGVVRTGRPIFSDYDTTVDGDKASSLVCVDQSKWGAKVDGEPIPDSTSDTPDPQPYVATLERRDSKWIVTDVGSGAKGVACPS